MPPAPSTPPPADPDLAQVYLYIPLSSCLFDTLSYWLDYAPLGFSGTSKVPDPGFLPQIAKHAPNPAPTGPDRWLTATLHDVPQGRKDCRGHGNPIDHSGTKNRRITRQRRSSERARPDPPRRRHWHGRRDWHWHQLRAGKGKGAESLTQQDEIARRVNSGVG